MNEHNIAIINRLRAAGLLDVAERAAKREELKLAHCIEAGEVTGGHRALWRALAAANQSNAQIAALVRRDAAEIDRESAPQAKPAPAPKSGPRLRGKPTPVRPPVVSVPLSVPETAIARLASLEGLFTNLVTDAERFLSDAKGAKAEVSKLRAALCDDNSAAGTAARDFAIAHLRVNGDTSNVAVTIAGERGISPELLLSGSMQRDVCAARRAIAVRLVTIEKKSQAETARILNVCDAAVQQMVARAKAAA